MHPACELRGTKSTILKNKRIALGVTGSIAAVNTIALARELIRHGADVIPIMTHAATKIIHPDALEFATSHQPIITLTGQTEHVSYCGMIQHPVDLLLITPCTANTLSKIIHGIDDSAVTTFATTAIGTKIPILLVPAMHLSMYQHTILQENIAKCKQNGIHILQPNITEHKAKMPQNQQILTTITHLIGNQKLKNEIILIIGGTTQEPIDDIRILTTKSSGITAITLAQTAYEHGASTHLWLSTNIPPPNSPIQTQQFSSFKDLKKLIESTDLKKYSTIILCAAIADYHPKYQSGKIKSGQNKLTIKLEPTPKLLPIIREKAPQAKIIAYKLDAQKNTLKNNATNLLKKHHLFMVIGNTPNALANHSNSITIYQKNKPPKNFKDDKKILAEKILNLVKE